MLVYVTFNQLDQLLKKFLIINLMLTLKVFYLLFKKLYQSLLMVVQLFLLVHLGQFKVNHQQVSIVQRKQLFDHLHVVGLDLKDRKIRVNILSPGPIDTPLIRTVGDTKEDTEKILHYLATISPMGRIGQSSEVAKVAVFLASDDSSYITGIELFVDGGAAQI